MAQMARMAKMTRMAVVGGQMPKNVTTIMGNVAVQRIFVPGNDNIIPAAAGRGSASPP